MKLSMKFKSKKMLKRFLLVLVLCVFFGAVLIVLFNRFPSAPKPSVFLDSENVDLSLFSSGYGSVNWVKNDNKLFYVAPDSSVGILSVFSDDIPSEEKKPGRIMVSVRMPRNFNSIDQNCLFGLRIGEKSSPNEEKIFIGLDGSGLIKVLNGKLEELDSAIETNYQSGFKISDLPLRVPVVPDLDEIRLTVCFYKNPYGWIVYGSLSGDPEIKNSAHLVRVNKVPYSYLSSNPKEISLIAYNPTEESYVWFRDLRVYNDWSPND